jgi:hypothetical protein
MEDSMTGYIIKRSETDYVVNCDSQGNGGYNVVPREIDPCNAYTLEQVRTYLLDNPEMLIDLEANNAEKARLSELSTLKAYLADTDYIYPKCLELGLDVTTEYADIVSKRKEARARIQELQDFDK